MGTHVGHYNFSTSLLILFLAIALLCGCASRPENATPSGLASTLPATEVVSGNLNPAPSPSILLVGKVILVRPSAQFVVLNFPVGHLPKVEQRLFLYRGNARVGEVKVSAWQSDDDVVADIVSGDVAVGDEARGR